jgi:hypothetical protein
VLPRPETAISLTEERPWLLDLRLLCAAAASAVEGEAASRTEGETFGPLKGNLGRSFLRLLPLQLPHADFWEATLS